MKKVFLIIAMFFFGLESRGQLEKYIYDISDGENGINIEKLVSLLPLDRSRNVIIFSETDHSQFEADSLRTVIINRLNQTLDIDYYFFEWSTVDYFVFKLLKENKINVDSILNYQSNVLKLDSRWTYGNILKKEYNFLSKKYIANVTNVDMLPIDIGTDQIDFPLCTMAYLTRVANVKQDVFINKFVDSLVFDHRQLFNFSVLEAIPDSVYIPFKIRSDEFLLRLTQDSNFSSLIVWQWKNLFNGLFHKYFQREELKIYKENISLLNFSSYMKFRDSIMFKNLETGLIEKDWKNVVVSVSSFHSMYNYSNKIEFSNIIANDYKTLGQRLSDKYGNSIKRIALVCYKCKNENDKKFKKSKKKTIFLENQLAKKYNYAFVSLSEMRKDNDFKKFQFYFRPTFQYPVQSDWQNIFDGVIFIRNCECLNDRR